MHIQTFSVGCDLHSVSPASILGLRRQWVLLSVPKLNGTKEIQPEPRPVAWSLWEALFGSTKYWEKQNASQYLGAGSRSPVQPADVGFWAGFPLTAQERRRKPWALRSLGLRGVRKQMGHSFSDMRTRSTQSPVRGNGHCGYRVGSCTFRALEEPHVDTEKGCLW